MDFLIFVPSLSNLIDINIQWSSQCHWRNQADKKKIAQRCGNKISAADLKRREIYIHNLHDLISTSFTENINAFSTVKSSSAPKIRNILKELSELFVCKGPHKDKSAAIFSKWLIELEELKKARIRKILNTEDNKKLICQGKALGGTRCKNRIKARICASANAKIKDLGNARNGLPITRENLEVIAGLLMCRRYHQGQAAGKADEWFEEVQKLHPLANDSSVEHPTPKHPISEKQAPTTPQPSTPISKRAPMRDNETPESEASSVWSRASSAAASTPATSPPGQQRYKRNDTSPDSPLPPRRTAKTNNNIFVTPQPVTSKKVTRARVRQEGSEILASEPTLLLFEPYPQNKNENFMKKLYTKIKEKISPHEKSSATVYVFRRKGEKFCKIGYTHKGVKERIHEWERKCHQKVEIVAHAHIPYGAKIERLVHLSLEHQRRRETVCNSSKGCMKKHIEWFEDTPDHIKNVIGLWKKWIKAEPYDETGSLKAIWVTHIGKFSEIEKISSLEPWRGWIDTLIVVAGTIAEIKLEPVAIGDNDSTTIKAEIKVIVTCTEVEDEVKIKEESGSRKTQQKYLKDIHEIKEKNPHSDSLTASPVIPPQLDDPFITPIVPAVAA